MWVAFGSQCFPGPSSCATSREKLGKRKNAETCDNIKVGRRNLANAATFYFLALCLFWWVLGWIYNQSRGRRCTYKKKRGKRMLGRPVLYFPWLSHSRRQTADPWNWADGAAQIEKDVNFFEDCNLRLESNQPWVLVAWRESKRALHTSL